MNLLIFLLLQTPAPPVAGEQYAIMGGEVWASVSHLLREIAGALPYLAVAVVVFAAFRLVARLADRAVKALVLRMRLDPNLAGLLGGLASVVVTFIGLTAAVLILFPGFNPLDVLAGLGALTVVLGFIFKDLSENFFSGVMILWRKPFVVGDQIKIAQYEGVVQNITFRSTLLKTITNELAFIPNSHILAGEFLVKTAYKTRRVKFSVGIGYLDDIETGRATIRRAVTEAEGVLTDEEPMVLVSEFGESSVNFDVFFLAESDPINVIKVSDRVATNIKYALDKVGIDMPYPHTVVLFQDDEKNGDGFKQAKQICRPQGK